MNNSSISALYRNVLAILHIHLYHYFKTSVPVAPSSVQYLNKSRTTATCPCKPEDLINNVYLWRPNWQSHHASPVWSQVHKSSWMRFLFNGGCWSLQGELQPEPVTRFLRLHPLFTCRNLSKTPFSSTALTGGAFISLPGSHLSLCITLNWNGPCYNPHLVWLFELPLNTHRSEVHLPLSNTLDAVISKMGLPLAIKARYALINHSLVQ